MIIPDANLLIFAHNRDAPYHQLAKEWLQDLMRSRKPVGLPWIVISGFIRLSTHPRLLKEPVTVEEAIGITRSWLARNNVRIIEPGSRFQDLFFSGIEKLGTAGNLTTDAYLAALAIEYQAELHSCDTDFHRFPGLRWRNPLLP
jgi:toxin-antitoxin system PIN domain toxin